MRVLSHALLQKWAHDADELSVQPRHTGPVATVTLGIDAVVGETAADFVEAGRPDPRATAPAQPAPSDPSAFAKELAGRVDPVRNRLLEEAARLEIVRRAALDYVDRDDTSPPARK